MEEEERLSAIDRLLGDIDPHDDFEVKQETARENMMEAINNGWIDEVTASQLFYTWFQKEFRHPPYEDI